MTTISHPFRVLGVTCVAVLLVAIDNLLINVALPSFAIDLHASSTSLQWIVDGYSLPFAALMLAGGGLADRYGRRRVMLSGLAAFTLCSLFAALVHSVSGLITARALMGASAAFIFPATLSIVTVTFTDARQRANALGIWGATVGAAIAIGPVAGGAILAHFWYGAIFLLNVPLGVIAFALVFFVVPESRSPQRERFDGVGLALGTVGLTALTLAIIEGPVWGWFGVGTLIAFVLAATLLISFVWYELRTAHPLFDVRIYRSRAFSAGALAITTNFFLLFGFIFLITQYFQLVRGYSPLSAGLRTLPFSGVVVVTTPLGALLAARIGARYVVPLGLLTMAGALTWMSVQSPSAAYLGPVVGSMMLLALGFSLISAPSTAVTMAVLEPHQIGSGAAVNETNRELGGTLGVAVIGSVFASIFGPAVHHLFAPYLHHGLTPEALALAQSSMQAAMVVVHHLPVALQAHAHQTVVNAFMDGLHRSCLVAAAVGALGAVVTFRALPSGRLGRETAGDDQGRTSPRR